MKVSIIVPIYNVENEIRACLDSIFAQTYNDIEAILINDCSTDRSLEVVEQHCKTKPHNCDVIIMNHEHNKGASAARNTGINFATGDYLYFLDSDDSITPTCIESLARPLEQRRYDIVIGDFMKHGDRQLKWKLNIHDGEWSDSRSIFREHCHQNIYVLPFNKLCNTDFIKRNQLFFHEGVTHEDTLWSLGLALNASSLFVVNEKTYHYYIREVSVTGSETMRDQVNAYVKLLPLMVSAINNSKHKNDKKSIYNYFDDILKARYKICLMSHLENEYRTLRSFDPRPAYWILKNGMLSWQYMRAHFHRLLPSSVVFKYIINITDRVYQIKESDWKDD